MKIDNQCSFTHTGVEMSDYVAIIHLVTGNTNHPMSSIVWDGVGNLMKGVK